MGPISTELLGTQDSRACWMHGSPDRAHLGVEGAVAKGHYADSARLEYPEDLGKYLLRLLKVLDTAWAKDSSTHAHQHDHHHHHHSHIHITIFIIRVSLYHHSHITVTIIIIISRW